MSRIYKGVEYHNCDGFSEERMEQIHAAPVLDTSKPEDRDWVEKAFAKKFRHGDCDA